MQNKDLIKLIEYYQEEIKRNNAMVYFPSEVIVNNFIDYCATNGYEINNCVIPDVKSSFCNGFEIKIFESETMQEGKGALFLNPKNMPRKNEA